MESPKVTQMDPLVADLVRRLDEARREDFEERAGIIEFDAGIPRCHAECLALLNVLRHHPEALTGVTTLRIELDGVPHCLLTTDLAGARAKLTEIGGVEVGARNLAKLINERFSGIALLTAIPGR